MKLIAKDIDGVCEENANISGLFHEDKYAFSLRNVALKQLHINTEKLHKLTEQFNEHKV